MSDHQEFSLFGFIGEWFTNTILGNSREVDARAHHAKQQPFKEPSYRDVRAARAVLQTMGLPTELVLEILNYARYWPCHRFVGDPQNAVANPPHNVDAQRCLEVEFLQQNDPDFGNEQAKIKEITWNITSRDQGWTSEATRATFQTSSWIEICILRRDIDGEAGPPINTQDPAKLLQQELCPDGWSFVTRPGSEDNEYAWYLQGNRVATYAAESYHVLCNHETNGFEGNEGTGDGAGFLDTLRPGDRLQIWARAQYPGWRCRVESLEMEVYYSF